jgi:hypothetical protein
MDMSVGTVYVTPSIYAKLLVVFCVLWPFMAWSLIRHRGRSSAPLAAMLVPLALSVGVMWLGFERVLIGMAYSGRGIAAASAGLAEALSVLFAGALSAGLVAVLALIRRHRPLVDTPIAMLYTLSIAEVATALLLAPRIAVVQWQLYFIYSAAILAALIAIAAFLRAWLAARNRTTAPAHRYGLALLLLASLTTAFAVWQQAEQLVMGQFDPNPVTADNLGSSGRSRLTPPDRRPRPGQLAPRRPSPSPFQQHRKRVQPSPPWDTIRKPVTVCIAAYSPNANAIVTVSDTLLSNDREAYDGAFKCEPLHFGSSWFALYSGWPEEFDALRPRIQTALAPLKRPQFADVVAATKAAYASELVAFGDTEYLAPLGLSRTEFLNDGLRYLGDIEFTRILRKLSKVRLGTSLLIFGFDDGGGHIAYTTETGRVYRRDNKPAFYAIGSGASAALGLLNLDPDFWAYTFEIEPMLYKLCAAKFAAQAAVRTVGDKTIAMVCSQQPDGRDVVFLFDEQLRAIRDLWLTQTITCPEVAIDHIKTQMRDNAVSARKLRELIQKSLSRE